MSKCWNTGKSHIKRMRSLGHRIRLGRQKCRTCGAEINVTETDGWAFFPSHDKPRAGDTLDACLQAIDKSIVKGPLQGNGCDDTAQRNGMILAYNILFQMRRSSAESREDPA